MKGLSSSVAVLIIATISITLAGTTYFYTQGLMKGTTGETFEIIDVFNNLIIVKNSGTQPIQEFKVLIDGQEIVSEIKEPPIQPGKTGTVILHVEGIPAGRHELTIISKTMSQRWTWEFQYVTTTMETTATVTTTISETTTTLSEVTGESIEVESEINQGLAEVGRPVKWTGRINFNNPSSIEISSYKVGLMIPEDATNILVKDLNENIITKEKTLTVNIARKKGISYLVDYETPAPYKEENEIKPFVQKNM